MNMFNANDILAQLESGKSVDDLATAAAVAINEAVKLQEQKKKEAEKKKAEALAAADKENKEKDLFYLIADAKNFFYKYYGRLFEDKVTGKQVEFSDEEIKSLAKGLVQTFDRAYLETFAELEKLSETLGDLGLFDEMAKTKKNPKTWTFNFENKEDVDAIAKFLKDNGLS